VSNSSSNVETKRLQSIAFLGVQAHHAVELQAIYGNDILCHALSSSGPSTKRATLPCQGTERVRRLRAIFRRRTWSKNRLAGSASHIYGAGSPAAVRDESASFLVIPLACGDGFDRDLVLLAIAISESPFFTV